MASITIRRLDDDAKRRLRLRAARHGRSMEDEARIILRGVSAADEVHVSPVRRARAAKPVLQQPELRGQQPGQATQRVLLIIGGGIAAYKSLELVRRLRERGVAVRCILTRAAQEF